MSRYTHDGRSPSSLPWNSDWDVEAARILRTSLSIQDIKLICRFRPYQDENLPRSVLLTRWEAKLNDFLDWLHIEKDELCKYQKVEAIIKHFAPLPPRKVCWKWTPSDSMHETDPKRIATKIDEQSHSHFKEIPFEDWVRRSIGFYVPSVAEFCNQHSELRGKLSEYLNNNPEAYLKYSNVAKVRCHRHVLSPTALTFLSGVALEKSLCLSSCEWQFTGPCILCIWPKFWIPAEASGRTVSTSTAYGNIETSCCFGSALWKVLLRRGWDGLEKPI